MNAIDTPVQVAPAATLPPEQPLAMPVQSLRARPSRREAARRLRMRAGPIAARLVLFSGSIALTALLGHEMFAVLEVGGMTMLEYAMLTLFVLNIGWIAFAFVSALLGFARLLRRRPDAGDARPLAGRTALLLPVYNEDPASVIGGAEAMLEDLAATGEGRAFDLFVLSDSTDPDIWLAEEEAIGQLRTDWQGRARIYYRHRYRNTAKKAGNIADFVRRWGGAYDHMVVLDADSLMSGATLVELARRMEADPSAGIIQTVPQMAESPTLLAGLQRFATRIYGPLIAAGLASWFGNAGNYWGHNAIIRTRAFAAQAGLPDLPGRPPFGGHVLSHDFVEAALIRRGGYGVVMADDLRGSYEGGPPNLVELAVRDRRWCQGNLQHSRILGARGLHPLSRFHLLHGIASYLAAPLWFLFLLAGMMLALQAWLIPPDYFPDTFTLFPQWPHIDAERAALLFGLGIALLLAPKLMGLLVFIKARSSHGIGAVRAIAGVLVEILLSALIAPISMVTQSQAVAEILLGRDSGWRAQQRGQDRIRLAELWRFHRRHVLLGLAMALAAGLVSMPLLLWMSPAIAGLVLAVPVSAMMGSRAPGWLRHVLATPSEVHPPAVVTRAQARIAAWRSRLRQDGRALERLMADHALLRRHLAALDPVTNRQPGEEDTALATARLRIDEATSRSALLQSLSPQERLAVMSCRNTLFRLQERLADRSPIALAG